MFDLFMRAESGEPAPAYGWLLALFGVASILALRGTVLAPLAVAAVLSGCMAQWIPYRSASAAVVEGVTASDERAAPSPSPPPSPRVTLSRQAILLISTSPLWLAAVNLVQSGGGRHLIGSLLYAAAACISHRLGHALWITCADGRAARRTPADQLHTLPRLVPAAELVASERLLLLNHRPAPRPSQTHPQTDSPSTPQRRACQQAETTSHEPVWVELTTAMEFERRLASLPDAPALRLRVQRLRSLSAFLHGDLPLAIRLADTLLGSRLDIEEQRQYRLWRAFLAFAEGGFFDAHQRAEQACGSLPMAGDEWIARCLAQRGWALLELGRPEEVLKFEGITHGTRCTPNTLQAMEALYARAEVAIGHPEAARKRLGIPGGGPDATSARSGRTDVDLDPFTLGAVARTEAALGHTARAVALLTRPAGSEPHGFADAVLALDRAWVLDLAGEATLAILSRAEAREQWPAWTEHIA